MSLATEQKLDEIGKPVRERLRELFGKPREPKEVYGLLSEFLSSEGKLLRPCLCLLSCKAAGGKKENAVPAATAIEMFHNFTLIHDDIEDCSGMRRGEPCLHVKYGLPLALNAGDGLFMMVWQEALRISGGKRDMAQRRLLSAFTKVLEGQAVELGWYGEKKWHVEESEYYRVVEGKTGALIAVSCEVGALLGGADEKTCQMFYDFGMGVGVSFQIVDDILNIVGNEKKYGKEIGGDISEGKRTLMTIGAVRMLPESKKKRLLDILKKDEKSVEEIGEAIGLLKESGAVDKAMEAAESTVKAALDKLSKVPDSQAKRDLLELADYITKREK